MTNHTGNTTLNQQEQLNHAWNQLQILSHVMTAVSLTPAEIQDRINEIVAELPASYSIGVSVRARMIIDFLGVMRYSGHRRCWKRS